MSSKLYIDLSGRGGLAKKFAGDISDSTGAPQLRYLATDGQIVQGTFNPVRKYGFLAPIPGSFTTVTETDSNQNFTNEFRAVQFDAEYDILYAAENGNIPWTTTTSSLTSWSNHINSGSLVSGATYTDLEIYQVNGVKTLFMAYQKSGGGNIAIFQTTDSSFGSTSYNATWLSGTVSGSFNTGATNDVFMRTADNGYMYIFDGNTIHKIDGTSAGGTNGTAYSNVIIFPFGFFLSDAVDWRGNMWVAVQTVPQTGVSSFDYTSGESRICGVYVWDRQSQLSSTTDFIPMRGVREIRKLYVTQEGELRAIVISSERLTQIRRYNGSTFDVLFELSGTAFPRYRDSVGQMGQFTTWLGYDGLIYCHGKITAGDSDSLFIIGDTTATVGASPSNGAILVVDNNSSSSSVRDGVLWSAKANGGTMYNRYLYPHSTGAAPLAGNVYSPVKMLPKLSTVNYINVFCAPTSTTGSTVIGTITVYTNMSTTAFKTLSVTKDMASRGYINIPIGKNFCNSVQLKIAWDTGTTIGSDDFLPMYAEVDYTGTNTFR